MGTSGVRNDYWPGMAVQAVQMERASSSVPSWCVGFYNELTAHGAEIHTSERNVCDMDIRPTK